MWSVTVAVRIEANPLYFSSEVLGQDPPKVCILCFSLPVIW